MTTTTTRKTDKIVHDLEGLQKTNGTIDNDLRFSPRRLSTAKPTLIPIETKFEKQSAKRGSQDAKLTRKRAARACDQCRRRKSRCDGQTDCGACRVVGLDCSYGHTIKQSRGPSYVAHLEKKVHELEERIKTTCGVSGTCLGTAESHSPKDNGTSTAECSPTCFDWKVLPFSSHSLSDHQISFLGNNAGPNEKPRSSIYLSTITSEPRARPYGIDTLRQIWNYSTSTQGSVSSLRLAQALDNPISTDTLPVDSPPLLPAKTELVRIVGVAFAEIWHYIDRVQVQVIIYRLYNTSTFGQGENDKDDLALLYSLMALGQRFDTPKDPNVTDCRMQGAEYFFAARNIVPLQDCDRSLPALQTIICLAQYLKAAQALTHAHAYVSAAASAGLRMGLHDPSLYIAEEDQAIKRRVWSTIRTMDVLTSGMLGLPRIVSIQPSDEQVFPSGANGFETDLAIGSAHVQLCRIWCRALENSYCSPFVRKPSSMGSFAVTEESMRKASAELDFWFQNCPVLTTPLENMTRCQLLLLYGHSFCELNLFSPFIHHLASPPGDTARPESIYASRAFNAALSAVRTAETLHKHGWLHEGYFTVIDVLTIASVVLLAVERTITAGAMLSEAAQCRKRAKELLLYLGRNNPAARDIWTLLESVKIGSQEAMPAASYKQPPTLYSQDSAVDVASPVGSHFNPSPLLLRPDGTSFPMSAQVNPMSG